MTEQLTMNRVIHGAVRRDLDRLEHALGQMAEGDRARAQALDRAYRNLQTELTHHHEGEDTHIWPMLASVGVDQQLLDTMESEHHAMAEALAETRSAMAAVAMSGSRADAAAARGSLLRTRDVTERHLRHEETELEPLLAPHMDSPEWHAVEKKLRSQPLPVAGRFFAWLTDGMSEENRAVLKRSVPTPVVTVLSRVFGRRYYKDVAPTWR
ncbi:Hemerythrin HHE cation binding domain-containing protein [Blastococcus aurantiacus]|uniref:Hemerythrin HHE cation binding domain-containing protein n=1 Tax=Blastococcus aurantiacus TaxID=1550231 RepID=A0A1G7HGR3_9ACTN|nr:hemerythrin domain-containing protein [Blastococcus aurantiacus]SDE99680.1 Hemerythrin HHE cation binding domain-containing protein [Blastococcus aurantiacus]